MVMKIDSPEGWIAWKKKSPPVSLLGLDDPRARNRMNLTIQKKRKTKWHGDDISSIGTQTNTK
jgi:hypothetical protein